MEIQAAAVANQIFVAVANRAGVDGELHFFGRSFVAGPTGRVVARARAEEEELLLTDVDLAEIEAARRHLPFLRDFRYDLYRRHSSAELGRHSRAAEGWIAPVREDR